jgi:hypothetical protein
MEETRRRKPLVGWFVVGVVIGVVATSTISLVWGIYQERYSLKINLGDFVRIYHYFDNSDRRANISVDLFNTGGMDGYAEVMFYIECNEHVQDVEIMTVFVPAHSRVKVTADLDTPEPPATYRPHEMILHQWKE